VRRCQRDANFTAPPAQPAGGAVCFLLNDSPVRLVRAALGVLLLSAAANPVLAAVDIDAGLTVNFENNVWRLSDKERAAFRSNPAPYRAVGIESPADVYLSPHLLLSRDGAGAKRSRLYLAGDLYARNSRLSSGYVYLDHRLPLAGKTRLTLYADYRPETFVGESDRDGTVGEIAEEFVTSATVGGSLSYRPRRGTELKLTADVAGEDYTEGFDDQDSTVYTVGLSLRQRINKRWTVRGALWAQRRDAHELVVFDPGTGVAADANDISSESLRLDLSTRVRVDKSTSATVGYRVTRKDYVTANTLDIDHFDRNDITQRAYFKLYHDLSEPWSFHATVAYDDKNPSFGEERFGYTNFTMSMGMTYEF
jgi:hypothetical protein